MQVDAVKKRLAEVLEEALAVAQELEPEDAYDTMREIEHTDGFVVDPKRLEQFRYLVRYISMVVFGVDGSDGSGDLNVEVELRDRSRYPSMGYAFPIPYLHKLTTAEEFADALRCAESRVHQASEDLRLVSHHVQDVLKGRRVLDTKRLFD